jgi:hypothetical protein
LLSAALVTSCLSVLAVSPPGLPESSPPWINSALKIISTPTLQTERWDYYVTAKVRLLLIWVGAEDVGGGYIARGSLEGEPSSKVLKLVIGSDPLKAPRMINHWGAAVEIQEGGQPGSVFFGFMKSSNAASLKEAERETSSKSLFPFEADISYATLTEAHSRLVPLNSNKDFTFRDLDAAQTKIIKTLTENDGRVRALTTARVGCLKTEGFLSAIQLLVTEAVDGKTPSDACYVHNARYYILSLLKKSAVDRKTVRLNLKNGPKAFERTYTDLLETEFEILNTETEERTRFDLLLGTTGNLRGVPVQIHYQPNWWFQVAMDLAK